MSESDTASVECPLCGEAFDPTAAGGWCTNSECGEWQHETDVTPDQQTASVDDAAEDESAASADGADSLEDAEDESDAEPPSWVSESRNGSEDADRAGSESTDDGDANADAAEDVTDAQAADAAEAPAERAAAAESGDAAASDDADAGAAPETESSASPDASAAGDGTDEPDAPDEADATDKADATDDTGAEETFDCPGCGSSLDAAVNFCPDCGEDVGDLPADEEADELDACPSCGTDVDSDDNFCAACGEDLDAHRGGSDVLDECPDCGTDVDESDSFCAGCGADLDAHRSGAAAETGDQSAGTPDAGAQAGSEAGGGASAPDALALTALGKSVVVDDGDVVGREIRSLLTDAGRPEDEAVRVHREHVRFVRESDQFYVVVLGQNPTVLNGRSLAKGDREPVAPGDELELSDVVTLDVEAA